jgi:DNA-binding transcriptional LysR family regulator
MRLDLELIEVFCCVYEEGGFSKAASRLLISQPTVSGHIKNLKVTLTRSYLIACLASLYPPGGSAFYKHGRVILSAKRSAIQELTRFLNRIEGSLTISASTIPGEYLLPPLISGFHSEFPAVRIELRISDSETVCEEALLGKTEIGFAGARVDSIGLEYDLFASDELVLIVPNNEKWKEVESVSLDGLSKAPLVAREAGSGTRSIFEKKTGFSMNGFNIVGYLNSSNAIKQAVHAGLGIAVISSMAVRSEIASGLLKTVRIEGWITSPRILHVVNRNLTLSPIAEEFLGYVLMAKPNRL